MAKGRKTGGRTKGTRNKATAAREAKIASSGLTPLDYMLEVMRDPNEKLGVRLSAACSAAPYVHPKLASIEMGGAGGGPLEVKIVRFSAPTPQQLAAASLPDGTVGSPGTGLPPRPVLLASKVGQG